MLALPEPVEVCEIATSVATELEVVVEQPLPEEVAGLEVLEEPGQPEPDPEPEPELESQPEDSRASVVFLELAQRYPPRNGIFESLMTRLYSGPSSEERRSGVERLTCEIDAFCGLANQQWPCTIRNVGVGGLEIHLEKQFERKTRIWVCPGGETNFVTGRVVWQRAGSGGFRVGYEFDQDAEDLAQSWVAEAMLELGGEYLLKREPRRFVRVPTQIPSSLVTEGGKTIEVTLKDVSLGGCLLQSLERLEVPRIDLRLGGVNCSGQIINSRLAENGWMHHVRFKPLTRFERARLTRSLRLLLRQA